MFQSEFQESSTKLTLEFFLMKESLFAWNQMDVPLFPVWESPCGKSAEI